MLHIFVIEPQPRTAKLLENDPRLDVIGSTGNLDAWSRGEPVENGKPTSRNAECDLILLSAELPTAETVRFLQQRQEEGTPVVMIDIDESEDALVPLLEAGAAGYVPQGTPVQEIEPILSAIAAGKPPLAPPVATALVERMHELLALQQQRTEEMLLENYPNLTMLTSREREILLLIRAGASNQTIADELMIELGTVKNHVHNILKKLNVSRREQAASYLDLMEQTEARGMLN